MGEAKRRRDLDPEFGTKQKESWLQLAKASVQKISTQELILWLIILVSSMTVAVWSFTTAH